MLKTNNYVWLNSTGGIKGRRETYRIQSRFEPDTERMQISNKLYLSLSAMYVYFLKFLKINNLPRDSLANT